MKVVDEENNNKPFDGKVVVLWGVFRQILSVDTRDSRYNIVETTINFYQLWKYCKVLELLENVRLIS